MKAEVNNEITRRLRKHMPHAPRHLHMDGISEIDASTAAEL